MPSVRKAMLLGVLCLPLVGALTARAADLDGPYPPPAPYAPYDYGRPVVVRPVVVNRWVEADPQPYFNQRPPIYPRRYFYARRLLPSYYGPYRHFAYGPRPYGWYRWRH